MLIIHFWFIRHIFVRFKGAFVASSMWDVAAEGMSDSLKQDSFMQRTASTVRKGMLRACSSMMKSPLPAWRFNLYCGVLSEAACAQDGQLSSLQPQTGILSTWQTSKSGVMLQSHAVIKKKYLCHNYSALFLMLSLLRYLQKGVREASDLTFGRGQSFFREVVTQI